MIDWQRRRGRPRPCGSTTISSVPRIEWPQENRRLKLEICRINMNFLAIHQQHIELFSKPLGGLVQSTRPKLRPLACVQTIDKLLKGDHGFSGSKLAV